MRIKDDKILAALLALDVELRSGVSLAEMTSLGIGGTTDLLRIERHDTIPDLLKLLDAQAVPYKFLGGGSNLLVVDGELPGWSCNSRQGNRKSRSKEISPAWMQPPTSAAR